MLVRNQEIFERLQVRNDTFHDSFLLRLVGDGDLDRAIQTKLLQRNLEQQIVGAFEHEIGGQHRIAKFETGIVDFGGCVDFFFARQQRNATHLHQVHTHRIIHRGFI